MKNILSIPIIAAALFLLAACNSGKTLLPNVSGKAGEIIVVMDKDNWEGDLGNATRELLGGDCPWLASKEPLFNLVNVPPAGFADLFKVHRNILMFNIAPDSTKTGFIYRNDVWAHPQCIVQLTAPDGASATSLLGENGERVINSFEQAERDRNIANSILYENHEIAPQVTEMIGGSPHFPTGYVLRKKSDDFIWIEDHKQYSSQGIFIYKYPASKNENFTEEALISHRDTVLKYNVPGMFDNTYMATSNYIKPSVEFIRFRGRQFAQMRGFWEVQNDFMGGPFVSHAFYGKDGKDIIVLDAWVYAPRYDKRQYLRQVESIIYSFEWEKPAEESEDKEENDKKG